MRWGVADLYRRAQVCQAANERYLEALAAVQDQTPLRDLAEPLCRPVLEPRPTRDRGTTATAPEHVAEADGAATTPAPATPSASAQTVADSPGATPRNDGPPVPATTTSPVQPTMTVQEPKQSRRRRLRALNPLSADDSNLLEAVSRHQFLINGLRNRDVRRLLFPTEPGNRTDERRRSAAVSRKLRLLRAHGLIRKGAKTHR